MPSYKLKYFDARARAELTRYVFHAAGVEFEDIRYNFEKWPSIKPSTPFGQLPLLEVDGKTLAQSGAMARYLAREFGIGGKNSWEQAVMDQFIELAGDMFKDVVQCYFLEKDEEKKKELVKNMYEVICPKFCGFFQNALEQNGGNYLVGKELSLADLVVLDIFDTPMQNNPKVMDAFPKLKAHRERVAALPKLANYIKNRKESFL